MFFDSHTDQKIYIMQNDLWKNELIKCIRLNGFGSVKYNINLIENNEFIIRIYEPGLNKVEQIFASKINFQNKAEIFISIKSRDLPLTNDNNKYFIEIEKKYEKNIKNMNFNGNGILNFLKQMVYCQLELFARHGIVHNNIHGGNIFIETKNEDIKYDYINKILKNPIHYVLSDFGKCKIYYPFYFSGFIKKDIYCTSLIKNIDDVFILAKRICGDDLQMNINVSEIIKEKYMNMVNLYIDDDDLYKKEYDKFVIITLNLCWEYVDPIFMAMELLFDNGQF